MRRFLAAASAAAFATLAISVPAAAAETEYVALNEQGMKQVLLKKSWAPGWLGALESYNAKTSTSGAKPGLCNSQGKIIKGTKSAQHSQMEMVFTQTKKDHFLNAQQFVYQYADVNAGEAAWQQLVEASNSCIGTQTIDIMENGKKVGTATVRNSVFIKPSMYNQDQVIINIDVQLNKPLPGGTATLDSADVINIFTYTGAAISQVAVYKYVPKQKNFVFSEPQVTTVETLALLGIQRYHLYAVKAL
jgi:hypothetical protein